MHRLALDAMHAQGARIAAEHPLGRELGAVAHAERDQRVPGIVADHDLLPEPAAPATCAAGVRTQTLVLDGGMRQRLPDLDGHHCHVRGMRQRRPAVEAFERTVAAGGKVERGERTVVAPPALERDQVHHT